MPNILVVDDRAKVREQIAELTDMELDSESGWSVSSIHPFPAMNQYPSWIAENDVAVLILDEKLHEQASEETQEAVQYNGHNLVSFLRGHFPDFPIFIVTAVDADEEVQNSAAEVEEIIGRSNFLAQPALHVKRMVRAGQRFSEALRNDLSTLSELCKKAATGKASLEDIKTIDSIREKLGLAFPNPDVAYEHDLIPKAETLIAHAHALIEELRSRKDTQ